MAIYNVPTPLGTYANTASGYAGLAAPSSWSPDVGATSNAYINPFTGLPYTQQDIINQGGGDPNSIINVPHGSDFLSNYGAYMMLAPVAGMLAGAAGGAGAAGAGGAESAAGGTGMTAADLAETSALTGSGLGGLAGGAALPGGITLGEGLGGLGSLFGGLSNVGSALGGSNPNVSGGLSSILSGLGGIGGAAGSLLPGALALNYARNMTGPDLTNLNTIQSWLMNNQGPVVQAAQDPLLQSQAAGYGDLLQSQAARGIRGSSFGNTDIGNYLTTTGRGIADAGTNALLGSMGTAANLGTNIANIQNQTQQQKLDLYGRAVDAFGRALNPSGYAGNINVGGTGGIGTGATGSSVGALGQLIGGLGSLGSGLYSLFA